MPSHFICVLGFIPGYSYVYPYIVFSWQTQIIAAAAAGVAAEGLAPKDAKAGAENAAQLSVALVENAIVILMLVEDHLRLQSKFYSTSHLPAGSVSPLSLVSIGGGSLETAGDRKSSSSDSAGLSLDVCMQLSLYAPAEYIWLYGEFQAA